MSVHVVSECRPIRRASELSTPWRALGRPVCSQTRGLRAASPPSPSQARGVVPERASWSWRREMAEGLAVLALLQGGVCDTTFTLALLHAGSPEIDQGRESQFDSQRAGRAQPGCRAWYPTFSPVFSGNLKENKLQSILSLEMTSRPFLSLGEEGVGPEHDSIGRTKPLE